MFIYGIIIVVLILIVIFCKSFLAFHIIYDIMTRFKMLILCSILFARLLSRLASLSRFLFVIFHCLRCDFSCEFAKFHVLTIEFIDLWPISPYLTFLFHPLALYSYPKKPHTTFISFGFIIW